MIIILRIPISQKFLHKITRNYIILHQSYTKYSRNKHEICMKINTKNLFSYAGFLLIFAALNLSEQNSSELFSQTGPDKKEMSFEEVLEYNYYSYAVNKNCDTAGALLITAALQHDKAAARLNNKLNEISADFVKIAAFMQDHYTNDLPYNAYLENTCDKLNKLSADLLSYKQAGKVISIIYLLWDCIGGDLLSCAAKIAGVK